MSFGASDRKALLSKVCNAIANHGGIFAEDNDPHNIKATARELWGKFLKENATESVKPIIATVDVTFKGECAEQTDKICIAPSADDVDFANFEVDDDEVFFYVRSFEELLGLVDYDNGEDFYVQRVREFSYPD